MYPAGATTGKTVQEYTLIHQPEGSVWKLTRENIRITEKKVHSHLACVHSLGGDIHVCNEETYARILTALQSWSSLANFESKQTAYLCNRYLLQQTFELLPRTQRTEILSLSSSWRNSRCGTLAALCQTSTTS